MYFQNGYFCFSTEWVTGGVATFTYDSAGNRTDLGGHYGPGNRITQFANCSYTTDAAGDVTTRTGTNCSGGTGTLSWSAEGQLDSVVAGGATITLLYDAAGRLIGKSVNGSPTSFFLWDGSNLLAELDGTGTVKRAEYSYYPGQDHLHAFIVGSTAYYAQRDARGDIVGLTDVSQHLQARYYYDSWGKLNVGSDSLAFNGYARARAKGALYLLPELGMYYMRNRWYEPATGRFISEDPLGDMSETSGAGGYPFAADDPIDGADPTGAILCIPHVGCDNGYGNMVAGGALWGAIYGPPDLGEPVFASGCGAGCTQFYYINGTSYQAYGDKPNRDNNPGDVMWGAGQIGRDCGGGTCIAVFADAAAGMDAAIARMNSPIYQGMLWTVAFSYWKFGKQDITTLDPSPKKDEPDIYARVVNGGLGSGFELGERLGDLAYRDQLTWLNIVIQQEGWGGPVVIFEPIQNVWFVP